MGVILKENTIRILVVAGLCFAGSVWLCGETAAKKFTPVASEQSELIQVKVRRLILEPISKQPVIILTDSVGERGLPIWIDYFEANAIHSEIEGIAHIRPLTHDLLERIIQEADLKIHRIVITHLKEGIYYAKIVVEKETSLIEIDARPSDSIVLALKFNVPIFVSKSLFIDKSVPFGEEKEVEEDYGVRLQELTPSLAQSFSFGSTHGILVSDVLQGSRAERDGIERGDIFVELGGKAVGDVMSVRDALKRSKTDVQAKIFRKSHFLAITIHPK